MSITRSDVDKILKDRPLVEGVTIDGEHTKNFDDAFFITPHADGSTTVQVSVSDAPALVHASSQMDLEAQRIKRDFFGGEDKKLASMLPLWLVRQFLSLTENELHPAVTFTIKLNADMEVMDVDIQRTKFRNMRRVTLDDVDRSVAKGEAATNMWLDVARRLYSKRQNDMMDAVAYNVPDRLKVRTVDPMIQPQAEGAGKFLVHEIMKLTHSVATDYMKKNKLPMALSRDDISVRERFKVANAAFENRVQATMRSVEKKLSDMHEHAKVTSPSRSYTDLMNLRNIIAHVEGEPVPHGAREMQDAVKGDKTLSEHFKCASEMCRNNEELREALMELVAGRFEAVLNYQMKTVSRVQKSVEAAYWARMGQGEEQEVRRHAPRSENFSILANQTGGARPQFTVSSLKLGGTKMFFAVLLTQEGDRGRTVNVSAAGVSPNDAIDQAAAATLIHLGKQKPVGRG